MIIQAVARETMFCAWQFTNARLCDAELGPLAGTEVGFEYYAITLLAATSSTSICLQALMTADATDSPVLCLSAALC